jgi:hypothetical protein
MPDTEFWNKEFVITSVTRADLQKHGFPDEQITLLSDGDMETIASAMEDIYCDSGYWEDLELCTKQTLERKEEDSVLDQDGKPTGDEDGLT